MFADLSILDETKGEPETWLLWSGGFRASVEQAPDRQWLIPLVGLEAGQFVTPERTVGHVTPAAGGHVWSAEDFNASIEGSYLVPPSALETLRGWHLDAGVRFTFW